MMDEKNGTQVAGAITKPTAQAKEKKLLYEGKRVGLQHAGLGTWLTRRAAKRKREEDHEHQLRINEGISKYFDSKPQSKATRPKVCNFIRVTVLRKQP